MSLKAFEDACLRAELFGHPKPDKEEFLEKNKHLDVVEVQEQETANAEDLARLHEQIDATVSGMSELGAIVTSTQNRFNSLKEACGSLSNMLRIKLTSKNDLSYSTDPSYVGQESPQRTKQDLNAKHNPEVKPIPNSSTADEEIDRN